VGRYVDSIVGALVAAGVPVAVTCQPRDKEFFESLGAAAIAAPRRIRSVALRLLWEQLSLPRLAAKLGVSVVHSPHYTFPLRMKIPTVVTIHDLTFFTLPESHSLLKRVFFKWWIRRASRVGISVLADSEATASDFVALAGASPSNITVSHLGFDRVLFHQPDAGEQRKLSRAVPDLPANWIAFLGTLEPRKNVVALIEGYRSAVAGHDAPPALLLAGGEGWDPGVQPAIVRAVDDGHDVRQLGYLPLDTLSAFLGSSTIFVYPSLGEGFGLPVLEAMATGACVLTTRRGSLPEVGGNAVEYTGVGNSEIADALRALLGDAARRDELRASAISRADTFSWTTAAALHRDAYAKAVSRER
jgi:glycosyltransferase involved in cell wall biosynthesis